MRKISTIEAVCEEIKSITKIKDVYPYSFPATAGDTCVVVSFTGGAPSKSTVSYAVMQIVTRGSHPIISYETNCELSSYFKSLQDVRLINGDLVVHCTKTHPFPYYLGEDESRRHMYSTSYNVVFADLD